LALQHRKWAFNKLGECRPETVVWGRRSEGSALALHRWTVRDGRANARCKPVTALRL